MESNEDRSKLEAEIEKLLLKDLSSASLVLPVTSTQLEQSVKKSASNSNVSQATIRNILQKLSLKMLIW